MTTLRNVCFCILTFWSVSGVSHGGLVFDELLDPDVSLPNPLVAAPNAVIGIDSGSNVFVDIVTFGVDGDGISAMSPAASPTFADIPFLTSGGVNYFRFYFRFNEPGAAGDSKAFVDQFELSVGSTTYFRLFETSNGAGDGSLALGVAPADNVEYDDFGPGNNDTDGFIDVPVATFAGLTTTSVLKISGTMSGISAGNDFIAYDNSGTSLSGATIVPEPSALIYIGALASLGVCWIKLRRCFVGTRPIAKDEVLL